MNRIEAILLTICVVIFVPHSDAIGETEAMATIRRSLQSKYADFPVATVNTNPSTVKFETLDMSEPTTVVNGKSYFGFRFRSPADRRSLVWSFVFPRGMKSWYIIPQEGTMSGFTSAEQDRLAEPIDGIGHRHQRLALQRLPAESLEPNKGYVIWFQIDDNNSPKVALSVNMLDEDAPTSYAKIFPMLFTSFAGPIPNHSNPRTSQAFFEYRRQYYTDVFMSVFEETIKRSPKWDNEVESFLRDFAQHGSTTPSDSVSREYRERLLAIRKKGLNDPMLSLLDAVCHFRVSSGSNLSYNKHVKYRKKFKYKLPLRAEVYLLRLITKYGPSGRQKNLTGSDLNTVLKYLRDDSVTARMRFWETMPILKKIPPKQAQSLISQYVTQKSRNKWLAQMMLGVHHEAMGWDYRGSSFANKVTKEGAELFGTHLDKSYHAYKKAWELNPKDPIAPARLIAVAGAGSPEAKEPMRFWFDESVKREIDYFEAYSNFLWYSRPRWGGSLPGMIKFAEACVDTGRLDTRVPNYFVSVLNAIVDKTDGDVNLLKNDDLFSVSAKLLRRIEAYDQRKLNLVYSGDYFRATHLGLAYLRGDYDVVERLYRRSPDMNLKVIQKFGIAETKLLYNIILRGPYASDFKKLEELTGSREFAKAHALVDTMLANDKMTKKERRLLLDKKFGLTFLKEFHGGDWVDLPASEAKKYWRTAGGNWGHKDGRIVGTSSGTGLKLIFNTALDHDYVLDCKLEFVNHVYRDPLEIGVLFDYRDRHYYSAMLSANGDVRLQHGFNGTLKRSRVRPAGTVNLRIVRRSDSVDVRINGQSVLQERLPRTDSPGKFGFGGPYDYTGAVMAVGDVRVRKLPAQKSASGIPKKTKRNVIPN